MDLLDELNRFYFHKSLNELRVMTEDNRESYISYNSLLYLNIIRWTKNCTASYIAKALGVTKPAVTVKVNELLRQNLIVKTQSEEDKRVYYLTVRSEIMRDLSRFDRELNFAVETVEDKFSWAHIDSLCSMLHKLNDEYEKEMER